MRNAVRVIAVVVTLPLVTYAAPAQADDSDFISAVNGLGLPYTATNLISTARSACYFLSLGSLGRDPEQVTDRISRYLSIDASEARAFFVASVDEYCPQYRDQIQG